MPRPRFLAATLSALLVGAALSSAGTTPARSAPPPTPPDPATVVLDWERVLLETVYGPTLPPITPIPTGAPLLGYTSVAMYDGLRRAARVGGSQPAAVAQAAHDVLTTYYPTDADLAPALAASLGSIPDGTAKTRGINAGAAAAAAMVGRVEDPRLNPDNIVYDKAPAAGVWQPTSAPFLGPWLGFLDKLVVKRPIKVDGPDPITSAAYAFDYQEVKNVGAASGADRTARQTEVAQFFNGNPPVMYGAALIQHLTTNPLTLRQTARLFAAMHGALTDAVITCWRLKYDGYWRPFQAINGGATDGNPATVADPAWTPLIPNPPYPDYVSGHACVTGSHIETLRRLLGEETSLTLTSNNPLSTQPTRTFATLGEIEFDAFHARIWGGLHFRDAMEDGYSVGHAAARRALAAVN
jgi:hypothetical protein